VADNVSLPLTGAGGTTATVATDEVSSAHYQYVKPAFGADGTATPVSTADPLPVTANAGTNLNTSALATEATLSTYTGNQRASAASNQGSQVSVTASPAVTVLASNATRKGFRIYYPSAVWVSYGGTASSSTFLLPAGSVDEMTDGLIYTGAISAISVSGTITAYVVEW
jgi:hypothetical protein